MKEAGRRAENAAVDVLMVDDQRGRASSLRMLASRAFGDVRIAAHTAYLQGCRRRANWTWPEDVAVLQVFGILQAISASSRVEALVIAARSGMALD